jgi:predicted DNA-binding ribbon-helix-helix protein
MEADPTHIKKRSVRLAGHQTSVSIEDAFWDHLVRIAKEQNISINGLITELDANRTGNLSSAIRIHVLDQITKPKATGGSS